MEVKCTIQLLKSNLSKWCSTNCYLVECLQYLTCLWPCLQLTTQYLNSGHNTLVEALVKIVLVDLDGTLYLWISLTDYALSVRGDHFRKPNAHHHFSHFFRETYWATQKIIMIINNLSFLHSMTSLKWGSCQSKAPLDSNSGDRSSQESPYTDMFE